jgi:prepilin-type N-terminal cleavage/methylation domain-containing protein
MLKNKKRGFTLVKLIVVIAVIGILVLLTMLKFSNYKEKARLAKVKVNITELEKASERYYMDKKSWLILTNTPYTKEQIESFAKKIYDETGETVVLYLDGNYYDIDYDKLQKYIIKNNIFFYKKSMNYVFFIISVI